MAKSDEDLFDGDGDLGDEFDSAKSAWVKPDDLLNRLVLVKPYSTGERESTIPNSGAKTYAYIVTDTHVLDGEVTDLITEVPTVLEDFQWAGVNVVGQLKPKIRSGKYLLGRVSKKKAQRRGMQDAWIFEEPEPEDMVTARKYLKELAAKVKTDDPFEK
jgi:hypothetical protein